MFIFLRLTYYLGALLMLLGWARLLIGLNFYWRCYTLFIEWEFFYLGSTSLVITFLFDWMSLRFIGLVIIISSVVIFYRTYYIEGDKFFARFIYLVYFFVLSIVFIILSPNIIRILLGWDGLGLVSYCLVIFYQNIKSANAGIITVLSNRIGDVAILLCIAWLLNFGSWNFFYIQFIYNSREGLVVLRLVVLAAITKRAQMPFSAWLPAAIAAPTPVSALVHSSTLVTAGVYLLIRFNYIIGIRSFLFIIGVLTIFISGLGANFEIDLKKIIALSTLSQLGLMMISLGLGFYEYAFLHLMTHAIFKSLLFLCAGVFIHSMGDIQDIRMLGGLIISCPVTSLFFIVSSIALCGFPFLSGFFSKDIILEVYFIGGPTFLFSILVFIATILTLTYRTRLVYYAFFNNMGGRGFVNIAEEKGILLPIGLLIFFSVAAGGWASSNYFPLSFIFIPLWVKTIVLGFIMIFFILWFYLLRNKKVEAISFVSPVAYFSGSMWFLPSLPTMLYIPLLKTGEGLLKLIDQGWIEYLGGLGLNKKIIFSSARVDLINLINLKFYLFTFFMLIALVFLASFYLDSSSLEHYVEVVSITLFVSE